MSKHNGVFIFITLANGNEAILRIDEIVLAEDGPDNVEIVTEHAGDIEISGSFKQFVDQLMDASEWSKPKKEEEEKDEQSVDDRDPKFPADKQTSRSGAWPGEGKSEDEDE